MGLKEARGYAEHIQKNKDFYNKATDTPMPEIRKAVVFLNNRITELEAENTILLQPASDRENWKADAKKLEAQRDRLFETLKNLCDYIEPMDWLVGEPYKQARQLLKQPGVAG